MRDIFWTRWSREYINNLQQRKKWRQVQNNIEVDQIVLIKEDGLPPLQWRLARVIEVQGKKVGLEFSYVVWAGSSKPADDFSCACLDLVNSGQIGFTCIDPSWGNIFQNRSYECKKFWGGISRKKIRENRDWVGSDSSGVQEELLRN
ncbi:hypothetical protein LAZ67_10001273 [Cordylochernes scorpioides]|uniref:DUF5641 domain-containing protein n=1 Tax=Cordylochernes scorpioides TaxID=51811 RepID=A0ABY6KZ42_9ARAC|nr:hypothetical protein LAZ67_10001273 [Cordylochernes scorpioides]